MPFEYRLDLPVVFSGDESLFTHQYSLFMMLIKNLPADLYRRLQSWLEYDDKIAFAMVNRTICRYLIMNVRFIRLEGNKSFERYFRYENKRKSLIAAPYHQLTVIIPDDMSFEAVGFENINLICKSLSISVNQLTTSFIHCVKKVQDLILGNYSRSSRPSLTAYEHRVITDWMNNSDLGVKHFTIVNYTLTNLPLLSSLESLILVRVNIDSPIILNIPSYRCLRYLKLSSVSIEDVSSLDGIYELYLEYCNYIRDISCLNHNHKIVITDCESIVDYSKSFRYSKIIDISCPLGFTQEATEGFDLSKAVEAREIYVRGGDCNNKQLLLPHCLSLRVVQAG